MFNFNEIIMRKDIVNRTNCLVDSIRFKYAPRKIAIVKTIVSQTTSHANTSIQGICNDPFSTPRGSVRPKAWVGNTKRPQKPLNRTPSEFQSLRVKDRLGY